MSKKVTLCRTFVKIGVLVAMASLSLRADEPYQYIVTPGYDPAAASLVDSSSASSSAVGFTTGVLSAPAAEAVSLEARFRTWLESLGIALKSTRFRGLFMKIK